MRLQAFAIASHIFFASVCGAMQVDGGRSHGLAEDTY